MQILATSQWFYTHGFVSILLIALIFTPIGFLIGKRLWAHAKKEAARVKKANDTLKENRDLLLEYHKKLEDQLKLVD